MSHVIDDAAFCREVFVKAAGEGEVYGTAAALLGNGGGGMAERPQDAFDVHESLRDGLPGSALSALLDNLQILPRSSQLEAALGVSLRTIQRKKGDAAQRLSPEQAGRAWQFAEVLARASQILGSQEAAERWLEKPAIGLNRRTPIELLATPVGVKMVDQYLTRIEYGVYT
jgi:putative toxin-antitoxin system antitoxin component (TIGR02293 family)